jgi:hypothetical protein
MRFEMGLKEITKKPLKLSQCAHVLAGEVPLLVELGRILWDKS